MGTRSNRLGSNVFPQCMLEQYQNVSSKCVLEINVYHTTFYLYILNKKETSHAFLHKFQQKYTLVRYRQVCLLCDRYQTTRCTNSFLISTNCRRVSPIRLNARNHIKNVKCACPNPFFYLVIFRTLPPIRYTLDMIKF